MCERRRLMLINELNKYGENNNIEVKKEVPSEHKKYLKSVVAFANGFGGKIIFGIADKTREVVGFDKREAYMSVLLEQPGLLTSI